MSPIQPITSVYKSSSQQSLKDRWKESNKKKEDKPKPTPTPESTSKHLWYA